MGPSCRPDFAGYSAKPLLANLTGTGHDEVAATHIAGVVELLRRVCSMRVVVTGGAGLLGTFVVEAVRESHEVLVADIVPPAQDVEYRETNILELGALDACLRGADAVVHLAAIDAGNPFPDETYFRTNVLGTWNVLDAAERAGAGQVVIASSSSAYGIDEQVAPAYLPIDEAHPCRPTGVYGLSKVLIERTALSFADRGRLRVVCLRPAHIVRPATELPIAIQAMLDAGDEASAKRLAESSNTTAYGPLPALRGYVRSRDVARAFALALEAGARPFAAYNITAADTMGGCDTLARLAALYPDMPPVENTARYAQSPTASAFDATLAATDLGWRAEGGWDALLAEHGLP